jgi:hypothetical protein
MNITFTNISNVSLEGREPYPASKILPEWYKSLPSYVGGKKIPDPTNQTSGTIKRCMPVFDAMTAGYIIPTYVDLYVSKTGAGEIKIQAPSLNPLNFHDIIQAPTYPGVTDQVKQISKWMNPWSISTPKDYSCLFVSPMHHENSFFDILPGVVDTDTYTAPVNFPFLFSDPNFIGLIPAGTPLVQVIPFKRESWEINFGNMDDLVRQENITQRIKSVFFDGYKSMFRANKEFK